MLKKEALFNWTDECQLAFEEEKRQIASNRVLAHFNVKCPTIASTDASAGAPVAVLSEIQDVKEKQLRFHLEHYNQMNEHTQLVNAKLLYAYQLINIGIINSSIGTSHIFKTILP